MAKDINVVKADILTCRLDSFNWNQILGDHLCIFKTLVIIKCHWDTVREMPLCRTITLLHCVHFMTPTSNFFLFHF
jgi:hypothetical protein